jgi:hypothetical protein
MRNVGNLGQWRPTIDWAVIDYKMNDTFGIRAGKVKTVFGLYNDTQDVESLHTWALLPQSIYPLDLRGYIVSHVGGDIYGSVSPASLGRFSYTMFAGLTPTDAHGGYRYALQGLGATIRMDKGSAKGVDLKWATPMAGLQLGAAFMDVPLTLIGTNLFTQNEFRSDTKARYLSMSAQFTHGGWRVDFERTRRASLSRSYTGSPGPFPPSYVEVPFDSVGWYAAVARRVTRFLEVGTYYSRFYPNANRSTDLYGQYVPLPMRHIFDQAVTARFDIHKYWDLKFEGHFLNGYSDPAGVRGFYPQDNPQGLQPNTNLLVVRLGFSR